MEKYTNELIHESSPYLRQHAHNPVNWVPWSDDVFERAEKEDKLVLISVGYSACHWCHVMEHESFEDEEVAAIQNKFFISVKVDREEHPHVDQVYMTAVQLMTHRGGWPLNCFTLPDGRPIYGGTYFQKEQWIHLLKSLNHTFREDRNRMKTYAAELLQGIVNSELITTPAKAEIFKEEKLSEMIRRWSKGFDNVKGGGTKAPKFPLPTNFEFLLDYAVRTKDDDIKKYVETTLDNMALGGIYDQIGGGFARYSVDMLWKVPHFEKMLYDNGQLLGLYAQAYRVFKKPLYKQVVFQTIDWMIREMRDKNGAFYSALDADSEGVEGKYYVWQENELKDVMASDFDWVKELYSINQRGYWEDDNYILLRSEGDESFAKKMNWSIDEFYNNVSRVNQILLEQRSKRVHPGLDNKLLTSWNAMTLKGLCLAYQVFKEGLFLDLALSNAKWLDQQLEANGSITRSKTGKDKKIKGVLEDYANTIDAFITVFITTGEESYLLKARNMVEYCIDKFQDQQSKMFFFTDESTRLIARKMEITDNVIPSGNSVMARNLFYLSHFFEERRYGEISKQMLANVYDGMEHYGSGYSNWAILLSHETHGLHEVVCTGENAESLAKDLHTMAIPFSLICFTTNSNSTLPIFANRLEKENKIYVCFQGSCQEPVRSVSEALDLVIQ